MRCLWGVNIWAMSCLQLCDLNKDCAWHRNGSYRNGETININNTKTKRRTSFPVHLGFLKTWCGFCILPIKSLYQTSFPPAWEVKLWSPCPSYEEDRGFQETVCWQFDCDLVLVCTDKYSRCNLYHFQINIIQWRSLILLTPVGLAWLTRGRKKCLCLIQY